MGSSVAARRAGYTPKKTPTLAETISPAATAHSLITDGIPTSKVTPLATPMPNSTPMRPPTSARVTASIAVIYRDFPLLQTCIILKAMLILMINLVVDILYAYVDPRIRLA